MSKESSEAFSSSSSENILPPAKLAEILDRFTPDKQGDFRLDEAGTELFERALADNDLISEPPSEEEIKRLATDARQKIQSGEAAQYLESLSFTTNREVNELKDGARPSIVIFSRPIYFRPDMIVGAASFDSWMGRGYRGGATKESEHSLKKKPSLEVVFDYASLESAIPPIGLDGGIDLVLAADGQVILYSSNSHRTAAAKLRREPLGAKALRFYKAE